MGIMGNLPSRKYNAKKSTINAKTAMQCLLFGYIREFIEDKYALNIPFYLKALCLTFYGNICMQSRILNINQMNTSQYTLSSTLVCKPKYLFVQKIYDSKEDGFGSKEFDKKCGKFDYQSIIVAKTNQNHIICCYLSKECIAHYLSSGTLEETDQCICCLLQSPISTVPIMFNEGRGLSMYLFSND